MAGRWYDSGLRFGCQRCGGCCRGEPGYVWVSDAEIARMAAALKVQPEGFARSYLRTVGGRISLIERPNGDCVFYRNGCSLYEVRPVQCRTFPFWPEYVSSPIGWQQAARRCPGVGAGKLLGAEQVDALLCEVLVARAVRP